MKDFPIQRATYCQFQKTIKELLLGENAAMFSLAL